MKKKIILGLFLGLFGFPWTVFAQSQFNTDNGTLVPGQVILVPDGNYINKQPSYSPVTTSLPLPIVCENNSCGGGGGGSSNQGTANTVGNAWPVTLAIGGALDSLTNPVFFAPSTGATFPVTGTFWQATQPVSGSVTANAGTNLNTSALALDATLGTTNTDLGPLGATACTTDTGSCSLNALTQRLAQRLTTINTTLGTPFQAGGSLGALSAGSAIIGKVGIDQTTPGTTNLVSAGQNGTWTIQPGNTANTTAWKVDGSAVTQPVSIATAPVLVAGSAIIGKVGIDQTTPGTTNAVQPIPGTGSGCTPYHLSGGTAASTNSTSVKGSAGNLCHLQLINTTTVVYYLKLYDSATAPTCSSSTNIKHVYPVPPAAATGGAGGFGQQLPLGESYANGIGYCVTGGGGDTDNTNAAVGVYVEGSYK